MVWRDPVSKPNQTKEDSHFGQAKHELATHIGVWNREPRGKAGSRDKNLNLRITSSSSSRLIICHLWNQIQEGGVRLGGGAESFIMCWMKLFPCLSYGRFQTVLSRRGSYTSFQTLSISLASLRSTTVSKKSQVWLSKALGPWASAIRSIQRLNPPHRTEKEGHLHGGCKGTSMSVTNPTETQEKKKSQCRGKGQAWRLLLKYQPISLESKIRLFQPRVVCNT